MWRSPFSSSTPKNKLWALTLTNGNDRGLVTSPSIKGRFIMSSDAELVTGRNTVVQLRAYSSGGWGCFRSSPAAGDARNVHDAGMSIMACIVS